MHRPLRLLHHTPQLLRVSYLVAREDVEVVVVVGGERVVQHGVHVRGLPQTNAGRLPSHLEAWTALRDYTPLVHATLTSRTHCQAFAELLILTRYTLVLNLGPHTAYTRVILLGVHSQYLHPPKE